MTEHDHDKASTNQMNHKPGWQKALWFLGLWMAGVLALGAIGFMIRLVLG